MTTPVTAECQLVFQPSPIATGMGEGSRSLSLQMGEESTPAVVQYQRTLRPMDVGSAVPTLEKGVVLLGTSPGVADMKLHCEGGEIVPVVIMRGVGEILSRGWRQEEVEQIIRFKGHTTVAVASPTSPAILYRTHFYDSQGTLVTPPLYYSTGNRGVFRHGQPVYGAMILRYTRSYQSYRLLYPVHDYFLTSDDHGHVQQAGGSGLSPVVVAAVTPFDLAMLKVSRRVALQDITPRLREGNRVEVGRRGVIDRVFPTPPFQKGSPPADPRTGRTDYMDIERSTAVLYKTNLYDENGTVDSTAFHRENLENRAPENSYMLESFNRYLEE